MSRLGYLLLAAVVVASFGAGDAWAQGAGVGERIALDTFGDIRYLGTHSARSLGMGGAAIGIADDAASLRYNPAGLANIRRWQVGISGLYENTSTDYGDYDTTGINMGSVVGSLGSFTFGAQYSVLEFFDAEFEGRDRYGWPLGLDQEGQLDSYTIGFSWYDADSSMDWLALGLSLSYLDGDRETDLVNDGWIVTMNGTEYPDSQLRGTFEHDYEGVGITAGAQIWPGADQLVTLGVTFNASLLEDNISTDDFRFILGNGGGVASLTEISDEEELYAYNTGIGIVWRPFKDESGIRPLKIAGDFVYSFQPEDEDVETTFEDDLLKDLLGDAERGDAIDIAAGLEYDIFVGDRLVFVPRIGYLFELLSTKTVDDDRLYWHNASVGLGLNYTISDNMVLTWDVAYMHGWLNESSVGIDTGTERDRVVTGLTLSF